MRSVCKCDGVEVACDDPCEPETVTETVYVCALDGEEVSDPSECPDPLALVCPEGTTPFTNTATGETGCQENVGEGEGEGEIPENAGHLAIAVAGSSPRSSIVLGNSAGVEILTLRLHAEGESFVVNTLNFDLCERVDFDGNCDGFGPRAAIGALVVIYPSTSGTVTRTINDPSLFDLGHETIRDLGIFVPNGQDTLVHFAVTLNSVDGDEVRSGDRIQLKFTINGGVDFEAEGQWSGLLIDGPITGGVPSMNGHPNLTVCNGDNFCAGQQMTIRKTKPTISLASGSPSGAGVPGLSEVMRFNVAADSRGYVTLHHIAFKMTATDTDGTWTTCDQLADPTKWELFDIDDPSVKLDGDDGWEFFGADGNVCAGDTPLKYAVFSYYIDVGQNSVEIGAGETDTYVLRVDTTGASAANDDSIRISIPDETEMFAATNQVAILWEDDVTGALAFGNLINDLPVTGGTIVY
ncbi:hypothetical protein A2856_03380 [Candidatus Uhrbacteria bacterium RIFCSPHIGHO2_01_FULL_63_20]|uniref:Uncharacterized protein n=1 Tax=Candidatus Uhrbacteria bacterium RIFCSPHIGHO2_01_FULL_63_20 TaxID=1802385 RepID=A0A1F7TLC9_9BACT|nr:MAG: hypothetical protein A2856_03380 [Candidatus Uhrbacteria bacterium RIFCSPHIGHO2_01_FULL_63_20]